MNKLFFHCLRTICAALPFVVFSEAYAASSLPADRQHVLDEFIGQFVDFAMFDGTVLIDIGGDVVYEKSFGYANAELGVHHDADTRFRIASVSKALTDTAIAVMMGEGRFSLETKLADFLPDFPAADTITIGHMLAHTSGIPHTNDQPWGDGSVSMSLDEIIGRLAELPLDFEPGSDASYSNGGYAVMAKILELSGGGTFSEVMRQSVFGPLGMDDTDHIADARQVIPNMATGYEPGHYPGERCHPRFYAVEVRPGGGSFYSTPRDLLRFTRAIFREDFLAPEVRHDVFAAVGEDYLSQGRSPGFVAKVYYGPKSDVIVISTANSYAVPADWAIAIARLATGETEQASWPELQKSDLPIAPDDPRIGRYRNSFGGRELSIDHSDRGALINVDVISNSITAMVPLSDGAFLQPLYFQRCQLDNATRIITCRMLSGNERYTSTLTPIAP